MPWPLNRHAASHLRWRFRTAGLYDNLEKYNLPEPTAVFDLDFFRSNPVPFFHLARELYPGRFQPTVTHYFMRLLAEKGLLRRVYTQNIDTLERLAGIPSELLVEAHGSFATATCRSCRKSFPQEYVERAIFGPGGAAAKRATTEVFTAADVVVPKCDAEGCGGIVKPDIVFFGVRGGCGQQWLHAST